MPWSFTVFKHVNLQCFSVIWQFYKKNMNSFLLNYFFKCLFLNKIKLKENSLKKKKKKKSSWVVDKRNLRI